MHHDDDTFTTREMGNERCLLSQIRSKAQSTILSDSSNLFLTKLVYENKYEYLGFSLFRIANILKECKNNDTLADLWFVSFRTYLPRNCSDLQFLIKKGLDEHLVWCWLISCITITYYKIEEGTKTHILYCSVTT
jgi:hypothetical protein